MRKLILLLLAALPSWGALAIVQSTATNCASDASSGTGPACAFVGNVTSGNLIVVAVFYEHATAEVTAVSCANATLARVRRQTNASYNSKLDLWRGIASGTGACTIATTANASAAYWKVFGREYSGNHATPNDQNNGSDYGNTGSSFTTGDVTTTVANEVLVTASGGYTNRTWTAGTSGACTYGNKVQIEGGEGNRELSYADCIVSSTGTYAGNWTTDGITPGTLIIGTFKAADLPSGFSRVTTGRSVTSGRVN